MKFVGDKLNHTSQSRSSTSSSEKQTAKGKEETKKENKIRKNWDKDMNRMDSVVATTKQVGSAVEKAGTAVGNSAVRTVEYASLTANFLGIPSLVRGIEKSFLGVGNLLSAALLKVGSLAKWLGENVLSPAIYTIGFSGRDVFRAFSEAPGKAKRSANKRKMNIKTFKELPGSQDTTYNFFPEDAASKDAKETIKNFKELPGSQDTTYNFSPEDAATRDAKKRRRDTKATIASMENFFKEGYGKPLSRESSESMLTGSTLNDESSAAARPGDNDTAKRIPKSAVEDVPEEEQYYDAKQ